MPGLADEGELRRYVGSIFQAAMADPETGPKLAETGLVLRLECTDPDSTLTVDLPGKVVYSGDDGPVPGATMTMSSETANAYWQGKVNLPVAMARGTVKVEGEISKLLVLAPLSKKLFPTYIENLKNDGRDDLILP